MSVKRWISGDETAVEMLARVSSERKVVLFPPPLHRLPLRLGNVVELVGQSPSSKTLILIQVVCCLIIIIFLLEENNEKEIKEKILVKIIDDLKLWWWWLFIGRNRYDSSQWVEWRPLRRHGAFGDVHWSWLPFQRFVPFQDVKAPNHGILW